MLILPPSPPPRYVRGSPPSGVSGWHVPWIGNLERKEGRKKKHEKKPNTHEAGCAIVLQRPGRIRAHPPASERTPRRPGSATRGGLRFVRVPARGVGGVSEGWVRGGGWRLGAERGEGRRGARASPRRGALFVAMAAPGLSKARVRLARKENPEPRRPEGRKKAHGAVGLRPHRRRQSGSPSRAGSLRAARRTNGLSRRGWGRARGGARSLFARGESAPAGGGGTASACGGAARPPSRLLSPPPPPAGRWPGRAGGREAGPGEGGGRRTPWQQRPAPPAPSLRRAPTSRGRHRLRRAGPGPRLSPPPPPGPPIGVSVVCPPPGLRPFVRPPPARARAPPPGGTPALGPLVGAFPVGEGARPGGGSSPRTDVSLSRQCYPLSPKSMTKNNKIKEVVNPWLCAYPPPPSFCCL